MPNHLLGQASAWLHGCISLNYGKSGLQGRLTGVWQTNKKIVVKSQTINDGSPS